MENKGLIIGIVLGVSAVAIGAYLYKNLNAKSNFEVREYKFLKFSDVIELSRNFFNKYNISKNEILVVLKLREEQLKLFPSDAKYVITTYNKVSGEISDSNTIVIKCTEVDETLKLQFSDKDMLVINE